ncbi:MAG: iron chaperone [Acholeplasmatales bacterium]|nr:MAG: iron chaperone [Acholeplasmatales bacterium]
MTQFAAYLETISHPKIQAMLSAIMAWIETEYPDLSPVIKWHQPMYTYQGRFIIGFSTAKNHLNIAPEEATIAALEAHIKSVDYTRTKMLVQVKAHQAIDFGLLKAMIDYQMAGKQDSRSFWRST